MTTTTQLILHALLSAGTGELYGYEIIKATGLSGGTVYPILGRLEDAGWIDSRREQIIPKEAGRPPRRYYHLTDPGKTAAVAEMERIAKFYAGIAARLREQAP